MKLKHMTTWEIAIYCDNNYPEHLNKVLGIKLYCIPNDFGKRIKLSNSNNPSDVFQILIIFVFINFNV